MGVEQSGAPVRAEGERVYELRPVQRTMSLVFLPFFVVVGAIVLYASIREGFAVGVAFVAVWFVAAMYQGWYALRRMPTAIGVADEGLRFVTRAGDVVVPWADLRSVGSPRWDLNRQLWVWRWATGKLRSWSQYEGAHRLLGDVERYAPHADVSP